MRESRFPPFLSGPSLAAAAFAFIVVLAGLALLGISSPFWLIARDPTLRIPFLVLLVAVLLTGVGAYLFAAPRMWRFTQRYTPAAHGQKQLPPELLAACLKDTDFACPSCTYNLRGLQTSICPECNAPVVVYLYGTQKVSTRWTALIICWLAVMLVTSILSLLIIWEPAMELLRGSGGWSAFRPTEVFVISLVALASFIICCWRAFALLIPKPPHRQSISARRTAFWMAIISVACASGLSIVFAGQLWANW